MLSTSRYRFKIVDILGLHYHLKRCIINNILPTQFDIKLAYEVNTLWGAPPSPLFLLSYLGGVGEPLIHGKSTAEYFN